MKPKMWWFKRSSWPHLLARWTMLFASFGYTLLPSAAVWANPTGEQVVGGSATFERQGNTLTINQATDRLAVNWQDFSIAAGETTHFNMPSSASIALNRVLGGNPSQIYGTLSSNGNIILVNNAGIFVGPGGVVNAASFVGSTLDIDPGQFMNAGQGGYHLHGDSYAPIVNQGNITAEKGDVFLIAQKVENRGSISAPNGRAALVGAGRAADRTEVVLHEVGGSGFAVRVAQLEGEHASGANHNLPDGEELLNEGEIAAAQAELNASGNIYALAIKNTGTIRAKAVVAQADGTVRLDGGLGDVRNAGTLIAKNAGDEATAAGGKIDVTGRNVTASPESIITAAGGEQGGNGGKVKIDSAETTIVQGKVDAGAPAANAKGGKIELLGERVGLFDGAKVDASGGAGGGTVLIGGDYLGGQTPKPELKDLAKQEAEPVKNAKATVMASTAEIKAGATVNGDGGKIILWSDEYTGFYGQLFAQGGAEGGNGGFIETSSKINLQAMGSALASSPRGLAGLWLLDPSNVNIQNAAGSNRGSFNGNNPNIFVPAGTGTATADVATIVNSLSAGTSVTILTASADTQDGTITLVNPILMAASASGTGNASTLTLQADGNIILNASIGSASLAAGPLAVVLNAGLGWAVLGDPGAITINSSITTQGGAVTMSAAAGITFNNGAAVVSTGGGSFTANADNQVQGIGKFAIGDYVFSGPAINTQSSTIGNPGGSVTITSSEIAVGGALTSAPLGNYINAGGANVQLINSTGGAAGNAFNNSISVASLPSGRYNITQQTLDSITTTGLLIIGGPGQIGTIRVGSPDFVSNPQPYGVQFGANATTPIELAQDIVSAGKPLIFQGTVSLSPNAGTSITLDTTNGALAAAGADVIFLGNSTLNSDLFGGGQPRSLTVTAGTLGKFLMPGNIGQTVPLGGLTATAGGGIVLRGASAITTQKVGQGGPSGDVTFNSTILPDFAGVGTRNLTITPQNGGNVSFQALGSSTVPLSNITVANGGGTITLNQSIFTAGGAIDFGQAVNIPNVDITIDTTRLGQVNGAGISFRQAITGTKKLTLVAGEAGGLNFGGSVSGITGFTVTSGGNFAVDNGSSFTVAGNIFIQPTLDTGGADISLTTSSNGDITLNSGLDARPAQNGNGRKVSIVAGGSGNITVQGELNASGVSGTFVIPGPPPVTVATPGFDGGSITLTSGTGTITTGNLLVNADRDQTGNSRGGNAGTVAITSGGTKTIGGIFAQGGLGSPAGAGGTVTMAGLGNNLVAGSISVLGGNGQLAGDLGGAAGTVTISGGGNITLQGVVVATGGDGGATSGGGKGGQITLSSAGGLISTGPISTRGGLGFQGFGGNGGGIAMTAGGTVTTGILDTSGGNNTLGIGGRGGNIDITTGSDFRIPSLFLARGGSGTGNGAAFAGAGGTVAITTTSAGADVAFSSDSLVLQGNMNLKVRSAGNLTFGMVADFTQPRITQAGTFLTFNTDVDANGQVTPSLLANRGWSVFEFGSIDRDAQFFMPSSSAIVSNGGLVVINRVNALAPVLATDGFITVSGALTTSAANLAGGQVVINSTQTGLSTVGEIAAVLVNSTINTEGGIPTGTATDTQYGRNGGAVTINGTSLTVNQILTRGSASATTATVPAFGGAGGNITLSADDTLTLLRNLDSSGGDGRGVGDAQGGGGGTILLRGDVVLDSGRSDLRAIILNSQGGALAGAGADGVGGNITFLGKITGTPTTSNTLDLRYGNGTATLGDAAADTITLGTLITAADNARSTGNLIINGTLDLGTLTTFARGYGIQINGGGTIDNTVTFNNTGVVALGNGLVATVFLGGLDATRAASVRLQGLIESGDAALPNTGAPMSFGAVELVGNTSFDTNGGNLNLGSIDGAFNLAFLPGIAAGTMDVSSTVGAATRLGAITVSAGITQPVLFRDAVFAASLAGGVGTAIDFLGNVNLTGAAVLQGLTTLDNTLFDTQNSVFDFTVGADSSLNEVELASGPIRLTGAGNYTINGAVTGAQNLKLAGAGTKLFVSTVNVGSGVLGIEQADGSGTVTFQGDVVTSGVSTLEASVVLSGMTFTSASRVIFGGNLFDTVTLEAGTVTLAGAGEKVFNATVDSTVGLVQAATAGKVTFNEDVTSTGAAGTFNLAGDVEFAGLEFNSGGAVTLSKSVTLSGGAVTLTGNGAYTISATVDGGQNLFLAGLGSKSFTGAMGGVTAIGTGSGAAVSISGGNVTFGAINTASGISSSAGLVFNGNVNISGTGDTDSNFLGTVRLAGVTFTSGLGVLFLGDVTLSSGTTGGVTTLAGGVGGAYQVLGNLVGAADGIQSLAYTSTGDITFGGTVGSALVRLAGLSQSSTAGGMEFQGDVFTAGASSFAGDVILNGMTFDAGGATTYNTVQLSGGPVILAGAGAQTVSGVLTGNGFDLTLDGSGNRSFSAIANLGALTMNAGAGTTSLGGTVGATGISQNAAAGVVSFAGNVTTTGDVQMNGATKILGAVEVESGASEQTYAAITLAGNLTTRTTSPDLNAVTFGAGGVAGSGNVSVRADGLAIGGLIANTGTFDAVLGGPIALGGVGGFLNSLEVARIRSTGGATFEATSGLVSANTVTANTALLLKGSTTVTATTVTANSNLTLEGGGNVQVSDTTVNGALTMNSVAGAALFTGTLSTARSLGITAASISSGGTAGLLDLVSIPSLGNIILTGLGANFAYGPEGNLILTGRISLNNGDLVLAPSGNFINQFNGNPFSGATVRILTQDFFTYPNSAGVPGLTPVFGVTEVTDLGDNQIGVALPLLSGSAGPYITEFTTGTGQPYILATQNAVPNVGTPTAIPVTGAFGTRVTYTPEEMEMMTPAERSAFEANRRKQAARVILQREGAEAQEIGLPTEGETPQAKAPAAVPPAPTAQVFLDGKPLASKQGPEKRDSTKILRAGGRAVALRPDPDSQQVLEQERFVAELGVGSVPVAETR